VLLNGKLFLLHYRGCSQVLLDGELLHLTSPPVVEQEQLTIQEHPTSPPVVEQEQLTIQEHLTSPSVVEQEQLTIQEHLTSPCHECGKDRPVNE
jgi:hypothetical protein